MYTKYLLKTTTKSINHIDKSIVILSNKARILSGTGKLPCLTFPRAMSDLPGVKVIVIFTGSPGFSSDDGVTLYFKVLSGGPVKV